MGKGYRWERLRRSSAEFTPSYPPHQRPFSGDPIGMAHKILSLFVAALGAQSGEAKLHEVITAGGFRKVRRAAETPFNMILEARP